MDTGEIDTQGTTKLQLIQRTKDSGFDFSKVGYKTIDAFIAEVEAMDDRLFFEWFDLKQGDKFLGKSGNSWGHAEEFQELEFVSRGDWLFTGAGQVACIKSDYMVWTFMNQFGGKVK